MNPTGQPSDPGPDKKAMVDNTAVLDGAIGCLLGQLCGDALGSMVEFESGESLRHRYPTGLREIGPSPIWGTIAGQPTDDSELALSLARSLIEVGHYDPRLVAAAYCAWWESGPFDSGKAMRQAVRVMSAALAAGNDPVKAAAQGASQETQANGSLMRQSPLGI